ncbi:MAG: CHAD domain-containing protein, partial [Fimbriimonadales bacterium]|nr:CHAD domain-containing protein [Fimbriimonadales bacterium]
MRKEGYCAFGAQRTVEALEALQATAAHLDARDLEAIGCALEAAHRLQTCLTLFRACYPKARVALWKRRLRRLIRALNALRDDGRLIQQLETLAPPSEYRRGVQRALLRLRQRAETHAHTLQNAWRHWHAAHAPNEIHGLSQRWMESFSGEPPDLEYAQRQWRLFHREQASALEEGTTQSLEVRCGRLRALLEGAALLQPL